MKKADAKIADWVKSLGGSPGEAERSVASQHSYRALRMQVHQATALRETEYLWALFSTPGDQQTPEGWLTAVRRLTALGLLQTASAVATLGMSRIVHLPLASVLPSLPSVPLIEEYRRSAKVEDSVVRDFFLNRIPGIAGEAGVEWLLSRVPPDELSTLLRHLLAEISAGGSGGTHCSKLVQTYLAKDPKGARLAAFLAVLCEQGNQIGPFAAVIRSSDTAFAAVVEALGFTGRDERTTTATGEFVRQLFVQLLDTRGPKRRVACGRLARIGAGFLLTPVPSPAAQAGLEAVTEISDDLRNLTRDTEDRVDSWLLAPLLERSEQAATYITPDGARRWALAWEEAERSGHSVAALETLGYNLGLRTISEVGKQVVFAPSMHEDVVGGLLPGDRVTALSSGWSFNGRPMVRARVKRSD
jgi:hypothetical protein